MTIIIEATTVQPSSPPLYNDHFFVADSPYIDSCLNLSTTATFFSPIFFVLSSALPTWQGDIRRQFLIVTGD